MLRLLGAIFSVMMGTGPQIERPMFPKRRGEVVRRPMVRGQAVTGIVAVWEEKDMIEIDSDGF